MSKTLKPSTILVALVLMSGCSNTSKVDALHAKIRALESRLDETNAETGTTKAQADQTASQATETEGAANRAAEGSEDTSRKLDRLENTVQNK